MTIDILDALRNVPPAIDFVWHGFAAGTVGALVSPGGMGKSYWALQAAVAVAAGQKSADILGLLPHKPGKVRYLASEDPSHVLKQRLYAIGQFLNPEIHQTVAERLSIEPLVGAQVDIMSDDQLQELIDQSQDHRLIIFDTLSRIHRMDENSNGHMAQLIGQLERLTAGTGAAVLFLHHVSKGSIRNSNTNNQQAVRGASSLIDNSRWCANISIHEEEDCGKASSKSNDSIGKIRSSPFLKLCITKQNYEANAMEYLYQRGDGGVLLPIDLKSKEQQR